MSRLEFLYSKKIHLYINKPIKSIMLQIIIHIALNCRYSFVVAKNLLILIIISKIQGWQII